MLSHIYMDSVCCLRGVTHRATSKMWDLWPYSPPEATEKSRIIDGRAAESRCRHLELQTQSLMALPQVSSVLDAVSVTVHCERPKQK